MDFDIKRVIKHLEFLTSEDAAGRLSGSDGEKKAAVYLSEKLKEFGYNPIVGEGFLNIVEVPATRLTGPVKLIINGREYIHRIDFSEMLMFTAGGKVEGNMIVVYDGIDIEESKFINKIVLIPSKPENIDIRETVNTAEQLGAKALIFENGDAKWFNKTLFGRKDNKIPVLQIKKSLADELIYLEDAFVCIDIPIESSKKKGLNVLGFLGSPTRKSTILLSAHYDHLGDDPEGHRYPGAVDNASGVSVILEVARNLAGFSKKLPFNILIAFLTGEESGLWGSRKLINNPPIPVSIAVNLDALGYEKELHAMRIGHSSRGHWLPELASKVIEEFDVEVKWISGGDDSIAYMERGIPTLGLGQKPVTNETIKIHTPEDNLSSIHLKPLEKGFYILMEILERLDAETLVKI